MENIKYINAGSGEYRFKIYYLDYEVFLNFKKKNRLVPLEKEKSILQKIKGYESSKIYRLDKREVITYIEEICEVQIFKSYNDYEKFILFEQNREVSDEVDKKYIERSFCNENFEIIDFIEYPTEFFLKEFNIEEVELPLTNIFLKGDKFCYKFSNRICCLRNEYDLQQFKKHINQPVFANTHPYGEDFFLHREELYEILIDRIGIQLDMSVDSLNLIDSFFYEREFTEHFFYEVYASIFIYFGDCLINNDNARFSWSDNFSSGFYTPVIFDKKFDSPQSLDILIYENFINENRFVLPLVNLYDFLNREKANSLF